MEVNAMNEEGNNWLSELLRYHQQSISFHFREMKWIASETKVNAGVSEVNSFQWSGSGL